MNGSCGDCLRIFQKGFNYSQDGPGNRLVYHLQGCNLRCAWCANPEGMTTDAPLLVTGPLRAECCPRGAVRDGVLHRAVCKGCGDRVCLTTHRSAQLKCLLEVVPLDTVFAEICSCRAMFFDGGGVTFTGGEPTLQYDALAALLPRLRDAGIATALETNGTHRALPALFPALTTLMIDCKQASPAQHLRSTGLTNETVLENIRAAAAAGLRPQVRIPLIHGVNDSADDAACFAAFFGSVRGAFTVELLPYHEYGREKWAQCGRDYTVQNGFVSRAALDRLSAQLTAAGVTLITT